MTGVPSCGREDHWVMGASVALAVPRTNDAIVLLNPDEQMDGHSGALLRLFPDGSVAWRVVPAFENGDAFVAVKWVGDQLIANTWSCYSVVVDVDTGRLFDAIFTK